MTQYNLSPQEERPEEDAQRINSVFRVATIVFVAALVVFVFYLFLAWQLDAWQMYTLSAVIAVFAAVNFLAMRAIRAGKPDKGGWMIIIGMLVVFPVATLLISNVGLIFGLVLAILTFVVANQTLSTEESRKALIYGVGVGILTAAIDLFNLEYRLFVPVIQTFVPVITGAIVLVAGFFIARRAWGGNLRNKLLVAFIAVTVVATGVLGAYMITTSSNNLQENLERELSKVTLDRATRIGDLINEQINTLTAVSLNEALQGAVETQNSSYEGDAAFIQATLDRKDAQWQRADEADNNADPLVRENLTNAVARELIEYQQAFPANVEVFITDLYGGLAGTTNRTSDYFQADEDWWQAAYNNGEGAVYIAEPEFDESAGAIGVNIAIPLRDQDTGEITGILRTTYIVSPLTTILAEKIGQTGEADLYFPGKVVSHIHEGEFGPAEMEEFEALQAIADQGMAEMEYEGTLSVISQAQVQTLDGSPAVDNLGWVVVMHQQRDEAFAPVNEAIQGFIIVMLVVIALAATAAYGFSLFLVRPIAQLTVTAEEVSAGNLDSRAEVTTSDEVGTLATAFNTMTSQLQETLEGLEQRVAARTKALATSAEVTRRLATILDPAQLVNEVVNEVRNAFDYYYAQIYLLDGAGDNLVIAGGTGEAGASMLASGHSVPKGRGLVGRAADANASVLVSDTSQEEGWLPNELLPETRSEAAIPISVGNQVFGVLDVQHSLVNGLTEEDVTLLESLAGQVAISLQNARTYEQSRKQAELESLVNLIGQRIQRATTIEDTLQIAIRELGGAIGATRVRAKIQRVSTTGESTPVEPAVPVMVAEAERKNGSSDPGNTSAE